MVEHPKPAGELAYDGLDPKHQIFVDLVAAGGDQGKSWTKAGFAATGAAADVNASRWLSKAKNRAALDWRRAQGAKKAGFTIEEWHRRMAALCRFDPLLTEQWIKGEKTLEDMAPDERAGFVSLKMGVQGVSARAVNPLDALAKYAPALGITTSKVEITDPAEALKMAADALGLDVETVAAAVTTTGEE